MSRVKIDEYHWEDNSPAFVSVSIDMQMAKALDLCRNGE